MEREISDLIAFYGIRTVWSLVAAILAVVLARAVRRATVRVLERMRAHSNAIVLLGNLAQIGILTIGALVIIAIFAGPNFGAILTSFSILGLVVGLSLQDILKNFFAGIWILVERPFRIGDTIQVEAHSGVVEQIAFRTTMLRTLDGRQVVIPNNTLMTAPVVNHTAYPLRRGEIALVLPEEALPPDLVGTLRAALQDVAIVSNVPAPRVEHRGVTGGRARFGVVFWSPDPAEAAAMAVPVLRARLPRAEVERA